MLLFFHSYLLEAKPMPTPQPMEPMDSYLCILLSIDVISSDKQYTQTQICVYVAENQTQIDNIMNNPQQLAAVRYEYMSEAQSIVVLDKTEDCDH